MASKARTKDDFSIDPPPFDYTPIDPTPIDQIPIPDPTSGLLMPQDPTLGVTDPLTPLQGSPDLSSLPGGASGALATALRGLGLLNPSGGMNPLSWLSVLGPLLGGILSNRATSHATDQMLQANTNATNFLQGQMGTAGAAFNPFIAGGQGAVAKLQGMPPSNIAGNFRPLGSGRALAPGAASLASILNGTTGGH